MGQKGAKYEQNVQKAADSLLEKLSSIEGVSSKKMFGGQGIFCRGKMFGLVDSKGQIAFKVNESLEKEYLNMGSVKHGKMPYYSAPDSIFDSNSLVVWAQKSIDLVKD